MEKIFKSFKVVEKEGQKGTYYKLAVENLKGTIAEMYLTDSQKELIDFVGLEKCSVTVSFRTSKDGKTPYKTITLIAGEDSFDFFPKDKGFIPLSLAIARKKENK